MVRVEVAVLDWGRVRRARFAAWQCIGLGFLAAGFELATVVVRVKLPLGVAQFAALGLLNLVVLGLFAGLLGVLVAPIQLVLGGVRTTRAIAAQMGAAGGLLALLPLARTAAQVVIDGQVVLAALLVGMAPMFGVVLYFNARYWLARSQTGHATRLGFVSGAAIAGVALVLVSALLSFARPSEGGFALAGDRSAVLVTVDGLTRDDLLADGALPGFRQLAADGVVFADAVTPSAYPAAAHATVLTGLHPLRHRLLFSGALARGFRSLPQLLYAEGYATAGFVSAWPLGATYGFDQGFGTYDDDFFPWLPVLKLAVPEQLAQVVRSAGGQVGFSHRTADVTVARFDRWHARHADRPHFAWVHFADPAIAAQRGGDVTEAVARVERAIVAIRAAITERNPDDTVLIVLGATGRGGAAGLDEAWLRVPMVLVDPKLDSAVKVVEPQVRLMDVASTFLHRLEIDGLDEQEGVELVGYATGKRQATMWCPLVGRNDAGDVLFGMRNNGLKYVFNLSSSQERLYNLRTDPGETKDLAADASSSIELARSLLASDLVRLNKLLPEQSPTPLPSY